MHVFYDLLALLEHFLQLGTRNSIRNTKFKANILFNNFVHCKIRDALLKWTDWNSCRKYISSQIAHIIGIVTYGKKEFFLSLVQAS